jgi:uncharacterized protein (TIGR02996 family)
VCKMTRGMPAKGKQSEGGVLPGTIRLELRRRGGAHKFWQIRRDENAFTVTFGKVGTVGQSKTKVFRDRYAANDAFDKLIDDKKKKGYRLVVAGAAAPTAPSARNVELEQQILANPADEHGFMVYADWLQQQGDVRGELAALQAGVRSKRLDAAQAQLLWDQRVQLWGPFAPYLERRPDERSAVAGTWRQGWLESLVLSATSSWRADHAGVPKVKHVSELVRLVPACPSARFLRELVIARPVGDGSYEFGDAIKALAAVMGELPVLARLTLGRFTYEDSELSWTHLGKLDPLWPVAGRQLEYLKIRTGSMALGTISAPALRELRIETGGLDQRALAAIARASWPALETLSLWFGQRSYGCDVTPKHVGALLAGKAKLPRLRHLGLANTTFGDELCELVLASKLLPQLHTLDLSKSHLTDAGVKLLAAHRARLAHLTAIDLSECLVSDTKLAKTVAPHVKIADQNDPADYQPDGDEYDDAGWWRYSRVGE